MYQQSAQQTGAKTAFPSQQQAAGSPQGYGPPAQSFMYHMPPGQPQPVLTGQPSMGQQGQPSQYYVPAGQSAAQPVLLQPPVDQEEDVTSIKVDLKYLKSGLFGSRIIEFVFLSIAWPCAVAFSNRAFFFDGRTSFFKGFTIFCWVMVILFQFVFVFSVNKNKNYFRQPSYCTLVSLGIQVVLTILLITCTASYSIRLVDFYKVYSRRDTLKADRDGSAVALIFASVIFGMLACMAFLDDIRILSGMYAEQSSKEIAATSGNAQQPAATLAEQEVDPHAQFSPQPPLNKL